MDNKKKKIDVIKAGPEGPASMSQQHQMLLTTLELLYSILINI